jgi:cytochrome c-type biogenesis protein CcmH/NrfG
MKKESLLSAGSAFVVGLLLGVIGTNLTQNKGVSTQIESLAGQPTIDPANQTSALEQIVLQEPQNRNAWVQLGHRYFDSDQPMQAIDAYGKALEIDGNDADILTDQGIMFRRVGWYDRATENFEKAYQLNNKHLQSLYNLGVVYRYDLQDYNKAISAWSRFIELNPTGQGVDQLRAEIEFMQAQLKTSLPK